VSKQRREVTVPAHQKGLALMVVMAMAALGAATYMLNEFSSKAATAATVQESRDTRQALREARSTLLGAAISDVGSTERPGQLPWPDRRESASPKYDGWSDCSTAAFTSSHYGYLLGRFPYLGEFNPNDSRDDCVGVATAIRLGTRFIDGTGEPLWYAVSRNLLNTDADPGTSGTQLWPINPDIATNMPVGWDWLRVCDAQGRLISDRVAAVIIAPGEAVDGQSRDGPAPLAKEFLDTLEIELEGGSSGFISNAYSDNLADIPTLSGAGECASNGGAGEDFVSAAGVDPDARINFNDELVYITIDEIIAAVQSRAVNVAVNALNKYRDAHEGRLPWLSPFANASLADSDFDPDNAIVQGLTASASTVSNGIQLVSQSNPGQFDDSMVAAQIQNQTDGSYGIIYEVVNAQIVVVAKLAGGTKNTFSAGDQYEISISPLLDGLVATYTASAIGGQLVAATDPGHFDVSLIGAPIRNKSDGSTAIVTAVVDDKTLGISDLVGGKTNAFALDDVYEISTFRSDIYGDTTEGQLPFAHPDVIEDITSDFGVEWDFTLEPSAPATFTKTLYPNESATFTDSQELFATSSLRSGVVAITNAVGGLESGVCRYISALNVRCQGVAYRVPLLSVEAGNRSNNFQLRVKAATETVATVTQPVSFAEWGVGVGDRVLNRSDPKLDGSGDPTGDYAMGIISTIDDTHRKDRLYVFALERGEVNAFDGNDIVEVYPAAKVYTGTATGGSTSTIQDTTLVVGDNFNDRDITVDDVVSDDNGAYAFVTDVNAAGDTLTLGTWRGAAVPDYTAGGAYTVRSGFVTKRRIKLDLHLEDSTATSSTDLDGDSVSSVTTPEEDSPEIAPPENLPDSPVVTDVTVATVRQGYVPQDTDPDSVTDVLLHAPTGSDPADYVGNAIVIEDLDWNNNVVAKSSVTVAATTRGAIKVTGIGREMTVGNSTNDHLPLWFVDNGWHQFIYVAMGNVLRPETALPYDPDAVAGACPSEEECLKVYRERANIPADPNLDPSDAHVHAVVIGAGVAVNLWDGADTVLQTRPSNNVMDYMEGENAQVIRTQNEIDAGGFVSVANDEGFEFRPNDAVFIDNLDVLVDFNDSVKLLEPFTVTEN
jgi:hypothetical protein